MYNSDKRFVDWKSGKFRLDRNTLGNFGEQIVKRLLQEDGYKVRPFDDLLYLKVGCSKIQALVELCKKKCKINYKFCLKAEDRIDSTWYLTRVVWSSCRYYLSQYCPQVCKRFCNNRKILKIFNEVKNKQWQDRRKGGLDFVASKDKELWAVEIKTGKHSELDESQKEFVDCLRRELGIGLFQFHVCLNDELEYSIRLRRI